MRKSSPKMNMQDVNADDILDIEDGNINIEQDVIDKMDDIEAMKNMQDSIAKINFRKNEIYEEHMNVYYFK